MVLVGRGCDEIDFGAGASGAGAGPTIEQSLHLINWTHGKILNFLQGDEFA